VLFRSGIVKNKQLPRITMIVMALALFHVSGAITNVDLYAAVGGYYGIAREIATFFRCVLFVVVGIAIQRHPRAIPFDHAGFAVILITIANLALTFTAVTTQNPALTVLGMCLLQVSRVWCMVLLATSLSTLTSVRSITVTVLLGSLVSSGLSLALNKNLPLWESLSALTLCATLPIIMLRRVNAERFKLIGYSHIASGLGMTNSIDAHWRNKLALCLFCFSLVSGYATGFNQRDSVPTDMGFDLAGLLMILMLIWILFDDRPGKEDAFFSVCILLVVLGVACMPAFFERPQAGIPGGLMFAGRRCFDALLWLVLAILGKRNMFLFLPIFCFIQAISSLGVDLGAIAGHSTDTLILHDPMTTMIIIAVFQTVFVGVFWFGFRDFRFANLIYNTPQVTERQVEQIDSAITERCLRVADKSGLTERETEILAYLAKGRDGVFIARQLVVSPNTVKTHIRHIYAKLDIHNRQELLDLIENR
jgi:DNA-binding CsgD family transcriptional regulator/lipoprotein signal peptidase